MDVAQIGAALDRTDWDFPGSGTHPSSIHAIHWFPGKFISQIPGFLIQLLSQPGDTVLDPFSGSGTTAIEAALLGRYAVASDSNRAALQVAAAKKAILEQPEEVAHAIQNAHAALTWAPMVYSADPGSGNEGSASELAAWYHSDTLGQLRGIWNQAVQSATSNGRVVLEAVFSDTLFACASGGGLQRVAAECGNITGDGSQTTCVRRRR